jgi:large subunit ribosomal protein L19
MHPLIRIIQKKLLKKVPEIKTGYTVRISQKVKEGGKERIQPFEGLVIKVGHGEGPEKTFTVRKIVEGVGVEKTFPIHSPNITKIVVKKKAKVRRSKLYYMRERFGKSARLSERHVTADERAAEEAKMEEYIDEAVKEEEKRKKEEDAVKAEEGTEVAGASAELSADPTVAGRQPISESDEETVTEEAPPLSGEETKPEETPEDPKEDKGEEEKTDEVKEV